MGVLATFKANLRTKLTESPASLTNCPENVDIDDVPDSDKTFFAVMSDVGPTRIGNEHGGATLQLYDGARVIVRVAWHIDDDPEAFDDTKTNDEENVNAVVHKASNWTSGIVLVSRNGGSEIINGTFVRCDFYYDVSYRAAQNLA